MKCAVILVALAALVVAKPEMYKEKEDFQYSRSSSDDGSKSGFYGAQRGNMGGNYEHAHNMDNLAQHQMSGLVRQTEGELGDGANARFGSVHSSANSRGMYGSGNFDLSNLEGRNFQEGVSLGDLSAGQLSSSSGFNKAAYASSQSQSSRYGGHQAAGRSSSWQASDLLTPQIQLPSAYDYSNQGGMSSGYRAQSGYQSHDYQQSAHDLSSTNSHSGNFGSNTQSRFIAIPVRVVVRPGTRVAVPIAAQTYDGDQKTYSYDQNAINTEAEELIGNDRVAYRPVNNGKHYESSYRYNKQWEKHNTIPSTGSETTITENPFTANGEIYSDTQRSGSQYSSGSQSDFSLGYNAKQDQSSSSSNTNAFSQNEYNTGHDSSLSTNGIADSLAYTASSNTALNTGSNLDLDSQVENINTQPKSYQSSYSYHKSWERQGDPYVIKPASSAYVADQSSHSGTKSAYGSRSHQSQINCDLCGHARVARSYGSRHHHDQQSQYIDDGAQQFTQTQHENLEDLGQQTQSQWDRLEDLGQQSQSTWEKYEDLGQQSQNKWDQQLNPNTWDQAEDLVQQNKNLPGHTQAWSIWKKRHENVEQQNENSWNLEEMQQSEQKGILHDHHQFIQEWDPNNNHNTPTSIMDSFWDQSVYTGPEQQRTNTWNSYDTRHQHSSVWDRAINHQKEHAESFNRQYFGSDNRHFQWNHRPTPETPKQTSGLNNFWNKFDNIEKKLNIDNNDEFSHSFHYATRQESTISDHHKINVMSSTLLGNTHVEEASTEKTVTKFTTLENQVRPQDIGRGDIGADEFPSAPETHGIEDKSNKFNTSIAVDKTQHEENNNIINSQVSSLPTVVASGGNSYFPTQKKLYEASQSSRTLQQNVEQQLSLEPNQNEEQNNKQEKAVQQDINDLHNLDQQNTQDIGQQSENFEQGLQSFDQQNTQDIAQQTGNFEQGLQSFDHQNTQDIEQQTGNFEQDLQSFDQQNTQDIGQQNGNFEQGLQSFDQQNTQDKGQQPGNFEQGLQSFDQQNTQGIEQQNGNFEQGLQSFDQQNTQDKGLQPGNFEQGLQSFDQQNTQDIAQQTGNFEQDLQSFDQQNTQDIAQQTGNFEQDLQSFDQQNTQDVGQQTGNFEQDLQSFDQQNTHDKGQQTGNFEQDLQSFDQQNTQDFGQQTGNFEQDLQSFDQQNTQDIGQQTGNLEQGLQSFDQQNTQDKGQQPGNFEQGLQSFDQQNTQGIEEQNGNFEQGLQSFDQQNTRDKGLQPGNFEQGLQSFDQQNTQDIAQQTGNFEQDLQSFDQQNTQDIAQQTGNFEQDLQSFDQQNTQDVGQQTGNFEQDLQSFDQQNTHDKGQQTGNFEQDLQSFDQQNTQDFGQQTGNFEQDLQSFDQQNTQDIGQQTGNLEQGLQSFDQQNTQDKGQQPGNFEQNLQSFGQETAQELEQQTTNFEQAPQDKIVQQQIKPNYRQLDSAWEKEKGLNNQKFDDFTIQQESGHDIGQQVNKEHGDWEQAEKWVPHSYKPKPEKMEVLPINTQEKIAPKSSDIEVPLEPVTEKPGFWKSVGNKLSSAKDKVASWFGSG